MLNLSYSQFFALAIKMIAAKTLAMKICKSKYYDRCICLKMCEIINFSFFIVIIIIDEINTYTLLRHIHHHTHLYMFL